MGKLGSFLTERGQPGDADLALGYYTRDLEITERLAKLTPDSTETARDFLVSLGRFGDLLSKRHHPGDADLALGYYTRSFEEAGRLLKKNPDSAQASRDVSVVLGRLGDSLSKRDRPGDADRALGYFTQKLEINERLLKLNPNSILSTRDVWESHEYLGNFYVRLGNFDTAIESFQNGIDVLEVMIAKKWYVKQSIERKAFLERRMSFCRVADLATGDWAALHNIDAEYIPQLLRIRVAALAKSENLAELAQAGAQLRELAPRTNGNLYNAACAYGLCATQIGKGKQGLTEVEQAEQRSYLELALTCLKHAVAAGYNDFDHMKQDTDLTPLRDLPEFEALFPKQTNQK